MPRRKAPGVWLPHPCFPSLTALEHSTSRKVQHCHAKAMVVFRSGRSTSAPHNTAPCHTFACDGWCCWRGSQCGGRSDRHSMHTDCSFLLLRANVDCQRFFLHSQQSFISNVFYRWSLCRRVGCKVCSCRRTASQYAFCAYRLLILLKQ